ncbi:hypothetical protein J3E68DRAFT_426583 [Trichoderma sp. SZMC 28012]
MLNTISEDAKTWTPAMVTEFKRLAPQMNFAICETTGTITSNRNHKNGVRDGMTWVHFWFLREMFGPYGLSTRSWFEGLATKHPWMTDDHLSGKVSKVSYLEYNTTSMISRN